MGDYSHNWDCGATPVSAFTAMLNIISRPNDIFPFLITGPAPSIMRGLKYDLMNTIGPANLGQGPDPVEVSAISATSFTFTTLAGHHRGAGQTISFATLSSDGHIRLTQSGTFNSMDPRQYFYNTGATYAWALQAHNLRVVLGTVGSLPLTTAEGALDKVVSASFCKVF